MKNTVRETTDRKSAMNCDFILETDRVVFEYPNGILALSNVSIRLEKLKKHVFLGRNGAGKSTLFLILNGILRPKTGIVRFRGEEIRYTTSALTNLRKHVVVVMQNPDDQIFSSTVEEDVSFGPINMRFDKQEIKKRVDEAMALVGIEDLRDRLIYQLSFGQKKRVALAGALAMRPEVLILDEPTAGLDPQMLQWFLEFTDELLERGITVILSTHDVDLAYEWADVLHVLHDGKLVYSGSVGGFFGDEQKVYSSCLSAPRVFDIYKVISSASRLDGRLEPRSVSELIAMTISCKNHNFGKIYLVPIEDNSAHRGSVESFLERTKGKIALYGFLARKLFNRPSILSRPLGFGIDFCLREIMMGRDSTIVFESKLMGSVLNKLHRLEAIAEINIEFETITN